MALGLGMRASMAIRRVVAASDIPALQADAQVQPSTAAGKTVLAAVHRFRQLRDLQVFEMSAVRHRAGLDSGWLCWPHDLRPYQPQADIECLLLAELAVATVPLAALEVAPECDQAAIDHGTG